MQGRSQMRLMCSLSLFLSISLFPPCECRCLVQPPRSVWPTLLKAQWFSGQTLWTMLRGPESHCVSALRAVQRELPRPSSVQPSCASQQLSAESCWCPPNRSAGPRGGRPTCRPLKCEHSSSASLTHCDLLTPTISGDGVNTYSLAHGWAMVALIYYRWSEDMFRGIT